MLDTLQLGQNEYSVERFRLRKWLQLENLRSEIVRAIEGKDRHLITSSVYSYLSIALSVSSEELENLPWYEVALALFTIYDLNIPNLPFPMLIIPSKTKGDIGWDYEGRDWYTWAHMLAGAYGWNIQYIENLEIDDAIGLLQEILSEHQSNREWEWGLSEIAYPYDENSKKSIFKPLPRPEWMTVQKASEEPKKVLIRKDMLPVGNVIRYDDPKFREGNSTLRTIE